MSTDVRLSGVDEALKRYDPSIVQNAVVSAVNKMADQAKTNSSRMIRDEYNIAASRLNKFLYIAAKAKANSIIATIIGRGRGLSLSYFGARQAGVTARKTGTRYNRRAVKGASGRRHGGRVTVEVRRGSRKEVSGDPKPFITTTKSGHIGVFVRHSNKRRLPVSKLFGPGVGGLFGSHKIMSRVQGFINGKFVPLFEHELNWRSNK